MAAAPLGGLVIRAMILQGAASVFTEKGIRDASVEDILEAADISRRTFYRFFSGKDDLLVVLYRMASDVLVHECVRAVRAESDPLKQIERCIDAYLVLSREAGPLSYLLSGEAQRRESPLHAVRVEVHTTLVNLLAEGAEKHVGKRVDPLLLRALLLALEGVSSFVLEEGDRGRNVTDGEMKRARTVMLRILTASLGGQGSLVAPLPFRP